MKRVSAAGGSVLTIADAPSGKGGTWNEDGVILFCPSFNAPIYKVLATGGEAEAVTALDVERGDSSHRFPQFMDDGKQFTYLVRSRSDTDNVVLFSSLDATTSTVVLKSYTNALVVGDRILYLRVRTLVSQKFDQSTGVASGAPVPLAERIKVVSGAARMVVAAGPGLIVAQSGELTQASQLVWFDRSGKRTGELGRPGDYESPTLSRDGTRLAVELGSTTQGTSDIWIIDTESGNGERLTFEAANDINPVWSPDGRRIAYASNQEGPYRLMVKDVSGASDPEVLLALDDPQVRPWPEDWTADDVLVYVTEELTAGTTSIWTLDLKGDRGATKIADSTYRSPSPDVSPDGRWIVFGTGIDQGAPGIIVSDFPDAKRRWEVARGGRAYWSGDGSELFYVDVDDFLHAVDVRATADAFAWGSPRALFRDPTQEIVGDGDRFLIAESLAVNDISSSTFDLIVGWEKLVE